MYIKKWGSSGLLTHSKNPRIMAFCFEYCVNILSESNVSVHNGMIIPVVYYIINELNLSSRNKCREIIKSIIKDFPIFMEENINQNRCFNYIEWECKMMRSFKDYFLYKYENNKRI